MCGRGVGSIVIFPLVARCLDTDRCMYMAHVCLYVCCGDCVGGCGNSCCVAAVVKYSVFLALEWLTYVLGLCKGEMDVVFSFCIVTRGSVCARVWEV